MMGDFGGSGFNGASSVMKKRRSATLRRPRPDSQFLLEGCDVSPPSSTPSSETASRQSPDGSSGRVPSIRRKEVNLNSLIPKASSVNRHEGFSGSKSTRKYDKSHGEYEELYYSRVSRPGSSANSGHKRSLSELRQGSEDVVAQANWKSNSKRRESSSLGLHIGSERYNADAQIMGLSEGAPNGSAENKLKKVKLKLGGVTRTIHAKSNMENGAENASSSKLPCPSNASQHRKKHIIQDNSHEQNNLQGKVDVLLGGAAWQDVSEGGLQAKPTDKSVSWKEIDVPRSTIASEPVRKSKRVPKRRVLDEASDDEDEDDEIRYLEKLRALKVSSDYSTQHETGGSEGTKKQKNSRVHKRPPYKEDGDFSLSQGTKDGWKKSRSERNFEDTDYIEEEEAESDDSEVKKKNQRKEALDSLADGRKEISLTTRQRALQSAKDGSGGGNSSLIEFPNGLPPPPPRKQKEKLSEVEQQLKKAEAAQRRRKQVEKAARESEAEAIRKILGQDSSRKKREEKLQKKRDELAQERAAKSMELAANSVRWIMGPTGTTVTFPEAVGLPTIFNSGPCSYPPPREKCAGPLCNNAYKYRDSKSNLPLCSLQCYRAVQQSTQTVKTC